MKQFCYYEEIDAKTGEVADSNLCIFDIERNVVVDYIRFDRCQDGGLKGDEVPVVNQEPFFVEEQHFANEEENENFEEDEDGNPVDEDEPRYNIVFSAIKVYALKQNVLHLMPFTPEMFSILKDMALRNKMMTQFKNLEKVGSVFIKPTREQILANLRDIGMTHDR